MRNSIGLPSTWMSSALGDLVTFVIGGDWGQAPDNTDPDYVEVRCIRAAEVKNWQSEKGLTAANRRIKRTSLATRRLRVGDVVVEISGGGPDQPVGRTLLIDESCLAVNSGIPKICTNFFRLIRPSSEIESRYLNLFLQHFYKSKDMNRYQGGSNNLRNLKFEQYLTIDVPIAPKREQHRIVAKIEELFSELDKGVESLTTAREQLKVYRQAVLKHAFEGKLTADWRAQNSNKIAAPESLNAQLDISRRAYFSKETAEWERALSTWQESGCLGKRPQKPTAPADVSPVNRTEVARLPLLPSQWSYTRLATVAQIGSGMSVSKEREVGDPISVPYLRVANVQRGHLDLDNLAKMRIERSQLSNLALKKWDVLFNEGGDRDKLGRGWIWEQQVIPCITQNHVFRASPYFPTAHNAKFISYWGNTYGQDYFDAEGKQTTNLASINKTALSSFPLPLVGHAEQEEIVRQLEAKLSLSDAVENEIGASLKRLDILRQSILQKAFSGQLVGQDPNDEPASVLLERIKVEKEGTASKKQKPTKLKAQGAAV